jgi:hypothetical protein
MMDVIIITQNNCNLVCGVCEVPDGVKKEEVLKNWLGLSGLQESAARNFSANLAPVIPWRSLKDVFTPISELTPK